MVVVFGHFGWRRFPHNFSEDKVLRFGRERALLIVPDAGRLSWTV
jgi:hypothetical protein